MHDISNTEYYDEIAAIMDVCGRPAHACYLQGHWCGMSIGVDITKTSWLRLFEDEFLPNRPLPAEDQSLIESMIEWTQASMNTGDYDFQLMFPADDIEFQDRAEALVSWLEGFIAGFGISGIENQHLDAQSKEILEDMISISRLDTDLTEAETGERELMELYEYVRLCVLTLFENFTSMKLTHSAPTLSASLH